MLCPLLKVCLIELAALTEASYSDYGEVAGSSVSDGGDETNKLEEIEDAMAWSWCVCTDGSSGGGVAPFFFEFHGRGWCLWWRFVNRLEEFAIKLLFLGLGTAVRWLVFLSAPGNDVYIVQSESSSGP